MSEEIKRFIKIKSGPSIPDGVFSRGVTDTGFKFCMVERPWDGNKPDVSCIPRPACYPATWEYSPKHDCSLYHLKVKDRTAIELHSANVFEQLLGCGAPGSNMIIFKKDSIRPGLPSRDMLGVMESRKTLAAIHDEMRNKETGKQESFWLEVS